MELGRVSSFLMHVTHVGNGTSRCFLRYTKQEGEDVLRRMHSPRTAVAGLYMDVVSVKLSSKDFCPPGCADLRRGFNGGEL